MAVREKTWEATNDTPTPTNRHYAPGLLAAPVFLTLAALLVFGYQTTLMRVRVVVDGNGRSIRTHQTTVEAILREAGLVIYPEDIVEPALSERVISDGTITVQKARPVTVEVDGQAVQGRTHYTKTQAIFADLGVDLSIYDEIRDLTTSIDQESPAPPLQFQVERAVSVTVQEPAAAPLQLNTTARTVGEALHEAGIVLYLADDVQPSLSSPIEPDTRISINRSVPVKIQVDNRTFHLRTHRLTVGDVLADAGISLHGLDYAEPDLETSLGDGQEIRVIRVREEVLVQQESIPIETQWAPDPELEIDRQKIGRQGELGVFERRIRVRYEDGAEIDRWVEAEWVAKQPQPTIYNYGTKIVLHTLNTSSGPVQYWRKFRMLATSYNAASSGKAPGHPTYGITRLGWQMRFGIVAVDPRVVKLGSRVYVPGYGIGDAADTGGAIRNLRIDLGYDDDNLVSWYRCVDVYLLAPVPDHVDYILNSLSHPRCN